MMLPLLAEEVNSVADDVAVCWKLVEIDGGDGDDDDAACERARFKKNKIINVQHNKEEGVIIASHILTDISFNVYLLQIEVAAKSLFAYRAYVGFLFVVGVHMEGQVVHLKI